MHQDIQGKERNARWWFPQFDLEGTGTQRRRDRPPKSRERDRRVHLELVDVAVPVDPRDPRPRLVALVQRRPESPAVGAVGAEDRIDLVKQERGRPRGRNHLPVRQHRLCGVVSQDGYAAQCFSTSFRQRLTLLAH